MISRNREDRRDAAPFFSVIVTTYDRADLLPRALDSLIAQTETDWEAVIVDDASTDDTLGVVTPYLERYGDRIGWLALERNVGSDNAKNVGIEQSRGRFLTFLDSDDEYHPDHLRQRRTLLQSHPHIRFLHGGVKILGSEYVPDRFDYSRMIHLSECAICGTFFVERELARQLGGLRSMPVGSDGDFLQRVLEANVEVLKTDTPTYIYHREEDASMTKDLERETFAAPERDEPEPHGH